MKKLFVLCLLSFVFCKSVEVLAYTQADISNAQFLADQGIIVKQSTTTGYRLDSTITRAELVGIALKLKGVTLPSYQCKGYFSDIQNNDWICRAVEIAADNGMVTRANAKFRAQDNITRAEGFSIVYSTSGLIPTREYSINISDANLWQKEILLKIRNTNLEIPGVECSSADHPYPPCRFFPNRPATRAEVFGFVRNILAPSITSNVEKYSGTSEVMIKIRDARLPSLSEFTLASADVLQDTLVCAHNEDDEAPGVYLCTDSDYKEMMTTYKDFRKYLLQKDFENAWKMGKKLGPYFSGFGGEKYRIYQGSLITITFGPQAWGDVSFSTYTLLDDKIIKQGFAIHASDYTEWENAIVQKFQMKSFDDLYNGSIKYEGEIWNNIMKYADEYWYDRFLKTPIQ